MTNCELLWEYYKICDALGDFCGFADGRTPYGRYGRESALAMGDAMSSFRYLTLGRLGTWIDGRQETEDV